MFVTNWISPTKIQKISEITNFFRHYFLSRTEVYINLIIISTGLILNLHFDNEFSYLASSYYRGMGIFRPNYHELSRMELGIY